MDLPQLFIPGGLSTLAYRRCGFGLPVRPPGMAIHRMWNFSMDICMVIVVFVSWVAVVALLAAFALSLASKWGWLEWLQVNAPNEFFNKLFNCKFCCSWWMGVVISLTLLLATGQWMLLAVPLCSTIITRELW